MFKLLEIVLKLLKTAFKIAVTTAKGSLSQEDIAATLGLYYFLGFLRLFLLKKKHLKKILSEKVRKNSDEIRKLQIDMYSAPFDPS